MSLNLSGIRPETEAPNCPAPPSDTEKYWYMGRQHRWLLLAQAISFAMIAYSIARFATADTRLLLFLLPMSLYAITLLISLSSSARPKRTSRKDHEYRVATWNPVLVPSVDVFLPSAGEPLEILRNTYRHVAELDYDGPLTVHVLDDSARTEVELLAERFGFIYHTRPDRGRLKKAGNLRYGYEHSQGDYILVLDADFVPRSDALQNMLPYFDDGDVGIVQTPQFFDTHGSMNWLQRCAGATQELFYRWIQPSRDRARAAICVGTCALYSRAALNRSGGFAQIGHSEDVHTGVNLMKVGYHVRYVPVLVTKGLCPDTVSGFLNQQYRWCTGSMSLLADRRFHGAKHIGFHQRLCFWAGFLYYISTALNAFIAPLPALAMLYFLPGWVEPINSIWLVGALLLWFVILPLTMRGRWRADVLRVQVLYSFAHAVAIVHILTGSTKEWVATGAANTRSTPLSVTIGRTVKIYVAVTYSLIWIGLILGVLTYGIERFWAMVLLGALATWVHLPLLFMPIGSTARVPLREWRPQLWRRRDRRSATATVPGASIRPPAGMVPEASGPRHFRPDIQGLRTVAVLLVVLYHAGVPGITGGYVGVDVFFVISGFLITGHLLREMHQHGRISLSAFYTNRIRRLIPPAIVVLVATLVLARLFGSLFQFRTIALDAVFAALYGLNYRLALQGVNYQQADGPESPLQHFWSLGVEEQFYLIWPALIVLCLVVTRRRLGRTLPLVAGLLAVVIAYSLWASITVTATNAPMAYFSLHTRAWELGIGAVLALTAGRLARLGRRVTTPLGWIGMIAIVWSGLAFTDATPFPGYHALLPVLGTAMVIAAGCAVPGRGSVETVLDRRSVQGIGAVSYGWYLWHWPLLIMVPIMYGREFSWLENVQVTVIALWLATISYWLIESPTRRAELRRKIWGLFGFGSAAALAGAAMAMVVALPPLVGQGAEASVTALDGNVVSAVQRAVASGTQVSAAPSNLTPPLDQVANDQPVSTRNGCHLDFLMTIQGPCDYGDREANRTAVLVGDSHAQQWLPGLDRAAAESGWKLVSWTKAACSLADMETYSPELKRRFTECETWRQEIVDRIIALRPAVVIVSQSNSVPGTSITSVQWADRTAMTMSRFVEAGIPVAYIGDTPVHENDVPECLSRHLDDVGACNLPRTKTEAYPGRSQAVAQAMSAMNIPVVDPTDWFCTAVDCPPVIGNLLVYRDDSHISTSYAYYLAPLLTGILPQ